MTADAPYFFGYGSLVNRTTHDYVDAHRARLAGWRRAWRGIAGRPVATLTAVRSEGDEIEGLIAAVPRADWRALDLREAEYDRLPASDAITHSVGRPLDIAVYAVDPAGSGPAGDAHPILLSYLDVVVQGYLREYGEDGAERFFATTDGWDGPLLNDRAAPLYPRARRLSADETAFVDAAIARLALPLVQPS